MGVSVNYFDELFRVLDAECNDKSQRPYLHHYVNGNVNIGLNIITGRKKNAR